MIETTVTVGTIVSRIIQLHYFFSCTFHLPMQSTILTHYQLAISYIRKGTFSWILISKPSMNQKGSLYTLFSNPLSNVLSMRLTILFTISIWRNILTFCVVAKNLFSFPTLSPGEVIGCIYGPAPLLCAIRYRQSIFALWSRNGGMDRGVPEACLHYGFFVRVYVLYPP